MKILVLTNPTTHYDGDSIYPLLHDLQNDPQAGEVWVAASIPANGAFFAGEVERPATARPVDRDLVFTEDRRWFSEKTTQVDVGSFDAVLLRYDRPIEDVFLENLAKIYHDRVLVNHPEGIRRTGSKAFLMRFADLCPPMRLCREPSEVEDMARGRALVIKPLRSWGGIGLLRVDEQKQTWHEHRPCSRDEYDRALAELIRRDEAVLAVHFLPTIDQGDKRIMVVDGEVVGTMNRVPKKGSWIANLASGGTALKTGVDPEEQVILDRVLPVIQEEGIVLVGVDTLVDENGRRVLSEINTLNPGGLGQMQDVCGTPVIRDCAHYMWRNIRRRLGA